MPPTNLNTFIPSTWLALSLSIALGCGSAQPSTKSSRNLPGEGDKAPAPVSTDNLATVIATVAGGTIGPYIGYGTDGAMALYAPPSEKDRRWLVQPLDKEGAPVGAPRDVGLAPDDIPFAIVRQVKDSYVALWVRRVHNADVLEGVLLDKHGSMAGSIGTVSQANGQVVWADVFATSKGPLVLWTEHAGGLASLERVMLDEKGSPTGNAVKLLADVRAWEAVELEDGVALALVVASDHDPSLGSVELLMLDASGQPRGKPTAVSASSGAHLDVSLVRTRRSLLMAWTERGNTASVVHAAAADFNGRRMVAPRAPLPPLGDQALVTLVEPPRGNPDQALLVYEELPSGEGKRELTLATINAEAVVSDQTASLSFAPVGRPIAEFVSTPDGFVLLTQGTGCGIGQPCKDPPVPWYVRTDANLNPKSSGPFVLDALDRQPPSVVWSPGCTSATCFALAVAGDDPAVVVSAKLVGDTVAAGTPMHRVPAAVPPRPVSNRAVVASAEPLSELDAVRVGDISHVAWVTHFAEGLGGSVREPPPDAPGNPKQPMRAQLVVQRVDSKGASIDAPTIVSVRASSAGGVALAPSTKTNDVCVAWTAEDNGDPQVFLTRIGADGKRKLQRMITRAKGDAADVAIAPHDDGWIVAWVDWRDGNGEVYVTRVNQMLVPVGPERRITEAPGDASDVSLLVVGDEVLIAYGDSRDHATHGLANPYVQRLNASTLKRVLEERRIATSGLHTKGLRLSRAGQDIIVGWLTETPPGTEPSDRGGVVIAKLDRETLRSSAEEARGSASGTPISFGLDCEASTCHGAVTIPSGRGVEIEGVIWRPDGSVVRTGRLARAGHPSAGFVPPVLLGDSFFFGDRGPEGNHLIRRVEVEWAK